MFRNYLKTAWRNMMRNKTFSAINILGLALGIACSLLIFLWVMDERSVDNFHENSDRLYAVYEQRFINGEAGAGYGTPGLLANEMKRTIPEIKYASGFAWIHDSPDHLTFEAGNKILKFDACYADSDYFKMVSYPLIKGNPATALNTPLSLCISHKMAKAFFGSADAAMGKTLRYENSKELIVTGVFDDLPQNISVSFDCLINWQSYLDDNSWAREWGNSGPSTLVLLRDDVKPQLVESKIKNFLDQYNKGQSSSYRIQLALQRFGDVYLNSHFENGRPSGGRIEYVRLFSLVAVFILLIACINFMNLTTARSVKRAKEIGVRKVAGAMRPTLICQFLSEAMMVSILAVQVALVLIVIALPYFNQLTGKSIALPFSNVYFWTVIVCITIITGLASGSYPAAFLSSFKPIVVLKGTLKFSSQSMLFRKGLVVFQFVLSVILISGTIVVSQQIHFIQKKNPGFDRENLLSIPLEGDLHKQLDVFVHLASNAPGIQAVSRIGEKPTGIGSSTTGVNWEGKDPNTSPQFVNTPIGYDFVRTMDLQLVAGRDLSKDISSDSTGYLINESAATAI